jgi:hypothetical protein
MGVEWCVYPGDASFQLIPRYPRHWGIVSRSWLRKPTCRNRWLPDPIAWNWAAAWDVDAVGVKLQDPEKYVVFFGGVWGGHESSIFGNATCGPMPMRDPTSAGPCVASISDFVACHAHETVAEHHEGKVLDFSHKCPTDTLTRTGCALPWCSVQVRMGLNE